MGRNKPQPKTQPAACLERPAPSPPAPRPTSDVRLVLECPYHCGVSVRGHLAETLADVMGVHVYLWHQWQFTAEARRLGPGGQPIIPELFEVRPGVVDRVERSRPEHSPAAGLSIFTVPPGTRLA